MKKLPFALEDAPVTASEGARHMPGLTSPEQDPLEAAYRRPSACGPVDAGRMPTRDCGESGFDALAEKIGTGLLRAPVDSLDAACSEALSRLVEYLDIERAFIALCDRAADTPRVTHTVTAGGGAGGGGPGRRTPPPPGGPNVPAPPPPPRLPPAQPPS